MELTIVRHGQTKLNALGIVQGSGINEPLNSIGHQQAAKLYAYYKNTPFKAVLHSELVRTKETIIGWEKHNTLIQQSFWNEMNWGTMEGQKPTTENSKLFNACLQQWRNGNLNESAFGGETPQEVVKRQQIGLDFLWDNYANDAVLICTHGRAIRVLLCLLTQVNLSNMDNFNHSNTTVYQLQSTVDRKFNIIKKNNTDHLK